MMTILISGLILCAFIILGVPYIVYRASQKLERDVDATIKKLTTALHGKPITDWFTQETNGAHISRDQVTQLVKDFTQGKTTSVVHDTNGQSWAIIYSYSMLSIKKI